MIFPIPIRRLVCWALFLATAWVATSSTLRAEEVCDPGLTHESEDPRAYRQRVDRCEGLYRLKVNSDKLRLRSWTLDYEPYDPARPLEFGWVAPPGSDGPGSQRSRRRYRPCAEIPRTGRRLRK